MCIRVCWGHLSLSAIIMASCHLVCMINISSNLQVRQVFLATAIIASKGGKKSPSSVLFGKGPEKQSSWPCTTASHYQSHLPRFVFAFFFPPLSLSSILSPFNCLSSFVPAVVLLLLCFALCLLCLVLPALLSFLVSLPCLFTPNPPSHGKKKKLCGLHYTTSSFYPLITHSTPLA